MLKVDLIDAGPSPALQSTNEHKYNGCKLVRLASVAVQPEGVDFYRAGGIIITSTEAAAAAEAVTREYTGVGGGACGETKHEMSSASLQVAPQE